MKWWSPVRVDLCGRRAGPHTGDRAPADVHGVSSVAALRSMRLSRILVAWLGERGDGWSARLPGKTYMPGARRP